MPDNTPKTARKGGKGSNSAAAAATRAARASEQITVLEGTFTPPPAKRGRYPWVFLDAVGKAFLIAGATKRRQLNPPEGIKVAQELVPEGIRVIRVA